MTHQLYGIDGFFIVYTALWVSACMIAAALYFRDPQAFSISRPDYFRFLFIPWKVATFAIAALGLSLVAPYTGDPTWDYVDAAFMSVMTFVTAPWVVGTIYLFIRRSVGFQSLYVALCLWMFSASWSYDLYLLVRDGSYPFTWLPNHLRVVRSLSGSGALVEPGMERCRGRRSLVHQTRVALEAGQPSIREGLLVCPPVHCHRQRIGGLLLALNVQNPPPHTPRAARRAFVGPW